MKSRFPFFLFLFILFAMTGTKSLVAGELSKSLEFQLSVANYKQPTRALVVLNDQVDIKNLDIELRLAKASLAERHETVIRALQATADQSQSALRTHLIAEMATGQITGFAPHWLLNSIMVEGTPEALRSLALRSDVAILEAELTLDFDLAAGKRTEPEPAPEMNGNISNSLRSMRVPEVWYDLGFNGTGQVVGIMDSGVDATHPALTESWRGNYAPASECWLDVVGSGNPDYPVDGNFRGTLHSGLMVAHTEQDTVGVAPGALWIASNHNGPMIVGPEFDADVITSFEFMADPDGNPATLDDVPAVVLNPWGISEAFGGYEDCDSRWWEAMDACEAAGPVLIFPAGDGGYYGNGTIQSPGDRATSETSGFCVGATLNEEPFAIWQESGQGPSGCPGPWEIKPEVVAPGYRTYTTYPGGLWVNYTSTYAAASHVAGLVAIMRQAAPNADAETIKQALLQTSHDQGEPGDDNIYGRGFIDAYAAVLAVMEDTGVVGGLVTNQITGSPISGAKIALVGSARTVTTDETGTWSLVLQSGDYVLDFSAPDFFNSTLEIVVAADESIVENLAMAPRPVYQVTGIVTGPDGNPLEFAEIRSMATIVKSAFTDSVGQYSILLPGGLDLMQHLVAWGPWAGTDIANFHLIENQGVDFFLPEKLQENFESGDLQRYNWFSPADQSWIVDSTSTNSGQFSAHSPELNSGQNSPLVLEYFASEAGQISFSFRVKNWENVDYFEFIMDGDLLGTWSGDLPWATFTADLPQGFHVLEWIHHVNSDGFGIPTIWVDDIILPPTSPELLPVIQVDQTSIEETVIEGQTATSAFNISNAGNYPLDISIRPETVAKSQGGPDSWGYSWVDSDESEGPAFEWIDISTDGNPLGLDNEDMALEVDLGFQFLFYGSLYSELNISSNGFLSFVSTYPAYFNRSIPNSAQPNGIISPFWDDLNPATGSGEIYWKREPENGRFIVTWENLNHDGTSTPETFQAILNVDGSIDFQYRLVNNPSSCTVGIENTDGEDGMQVVWNDPDFLKSEFAIHINPVPAVDWVICEPWFGRIEPGTTLPIEVRFVATDLSPMDYYAVLKIDSNDRLAGDQTIDIALTVTDVTGVPGDIPLALVFTGAVPNPFNPMTELRFTLPNAAQVSLNVYDLRGHLVRSLINETMQVGAQAITWNGKDDNSQSVSSGRYYARLVVDGRSHARSMMLVR